MNDTLVDGFAMLLDVVALALIGLGLVTVARMLGFLNVEASKNSLLIVVGPIRPRRRQCMDVLKLTDEEDVDLEIRPLTAHGHEAKVDGAPEWSSSAPSVVEVVRDTADPKKAVAVSKGLGTARITVTADADLGDQVRSITGIQDIEVVAAEATSVGVVAGTPRAKADMVPATSPVSSGVVATAPSPVVE